MNGRLPFLPIIAAVLGVTVGCDSEIKAPEPPVEPPRVSFSSVAPERKTEFAEAVAAALRDFDDLYGQVTVSVEETSGGLAVIVNGKPGKKAAPLERALGVALANFEFQAPGMRFVATDECAWRILFPEGMQVAAEGKFNLNLP